MPLHRDIFWVGRQWAVTGYGMQAVNRKRHGDFDIEASRIWDEALVESLRAQEWLNAEDFSKGLAVARARYPQPPPAETPREMAPPSKPNAAVTASDAGRKPPPPATPKFDWRIESWPAQFTSLWRVRVKR